MTISFWRELELGSSSRQEALESLQALQALQALGVIKERIGTHTGQIGVGGRVGKLK